MEVASNMWKGLRKEEVSFLCESSLLYFERFEERQSDALITEGDILEIDVFCGSALECLERFEEKGNCVLIKEKNTLGSFWCGCRLLY